MEKVTIGSGGEVTLPDALLAEVGLSPGAVVSVSVLRGGLFLLPAPRDYVETTYGMAREMWLANGGVTTFLRATEASWRT